MSAFKSKLLTIAKSAFRAMGIEVSFANAVPTEANVLRAVFAQHRPDCLLDVGANTGQFAELARRSGFRGPIVSFEPLSTAHAKLCDRAARDPLWSVADRCALGSRSMQTRINVAANSASSSLLDMGARHLEVAPHSAYSGYDDVDVVRLDDCIDRHAKGASRMMLKIDTQGFELEVLRGADESLANRIVIVQCELSLAELYRGQPMMLDVCNALREKGFELRHVVPGLKDPASGALLQLDGVFIKT